MKRLLVFILTCMVFVNFACAELVHITFEPPSLPGGSKSIDEWLEQGVYFTGPEGMSHTDSGLEMYPDNGTAYLKFAIFATLVFQYTDSTPFQLVSVDLGEYATSSAYPKEITFVGHKSDGSTVTAEFTTDGIIDGTGPLADFETFSFGDEFDNLSYVEIPTIGYTMDNIFLVPIPEPTTLLLFGLGALSLLREQ